MHPNDKDIDRGHNFQDLIVSHVKLIDQINGAH
jgi:hypothetical protein